jgi:hypothetical protein
MDHEVEHKLETLRSDYQEVTGKSFLHFFCPTFSGTKTSRSAVPILSTQPFRIHAEGGRFNGPMLIVSTEAPSKAIL